MSVRHEHCLKGIAPRPLASYLSGLGVLRIVVEQTDTAARGCWRNDRFVLSTSLNSDELTDFLLNQYAPSPLVAPWNGGSGFAPGDNKAGFEVLRNTDAERFAVYRSAIAVAVAARRRLGLTVDKGEDKAAGKVGAAKDKLLRLSRATLPDEALPFIDAAVAIAGERLVFPPLLGTGGNDGRLDFTNNFMQRLTELFDGRSGKAMPRTRGLLAAMLHGSAAAGLATGKAVGQFAPGAAGGANQTSGFDGKSLLNPWMFVLMLEGALLFPGGVSRRMGDVRGPSAAASPFTVASAGGATTATLNESAGGDSRGELWLPVWSQPATLAETRAVFAEGRARVGGRSARDGVDFARAVATLGTDRGIEAFERTGLHLRNGLSYFAVPLGRRLVGTNDGARLIDRIDGWLQGLRRESTSGPASLAQAWRRVEDSIVELCRPVAPQRVRPSDAQALLIALADAEDAYWRSTMRTDVRRLKPLPRLTPEWLRLADDKTAEWRLALSLAATRSVSGGEGGPRSERPLRYHLAPVQPGRWSKGWRTADLRDLVPGRQPVPAMLAVLARKLLHAENAGGTQWPEQATRWARLSDVRRFIVGDLDFERFWVLVRALARVELYGGRAWEPDNPAASGPLPGADFAQVRLCLLDRAGANGVFAQSSSGVRDRQVVGLLAAGRVDDAARAARRRLRALGVAAPALHPVVDTAVGRRMAAALLFGLGPAALRQLALRAGAKHQDRAQANQSSA